MQPQSGRRTLRRLIRMIHWISGLSGVGGLVGTSVHDELSGLRDSSGDLVGPARVLWEKSLRQWCSVHRSFGLAPL